MVTIKAKTKAEKSEPAQTDASAAKSPARNAAAKKQGKKAAAKKVAKPARKSMSKADYVRRFPKLSPKEILEKAKADHFKLNANNISMTRTHDKAKKSAAKKNGGTTAAAKPVDVSTTAKAKGKPPVLAALVLKLHEENPTWTKKKIAKVAKCSPTYAYNVLRRGPVRLPKTSGKAAAPPASASAVTEFYKALKKIGLAKAVELIAGIEAYESA